MLCPKCALPQPAYTDATAFKALNFNAKREFITPHAQMLGQDSADRAVVSACTKKLEAG